MADVLLTLVLLKAFSHTDLSWFAVFMIPTGVAVMHCTISWMLK